MAEDQRKAELTAELAEARARLTAHFGGLRRALDFPGRVQATVRQHPAAWVGGATLFGLVLAKLAGRRKKTAVPAHGQSAKMATAGKSGLLLGALKIAFDLTQPALAKWVGQRVADSLDRVKGDGHST